VLALLAVLAVALVPGTVVVIELISDRDGGPVPRQPRPSPRWGLTHTQVSADQGDPAATASAEQVLGRQPLMQNQHIMGWGVGNPEPSPGAYDFGDLDRRMDLIRRTGGVPVITLCCAPDWMRGGRPGETDWSDLERAPLPEHYQDFADLAGEVAARYPDVRHFIVWNEMKGFFDEAANRWDYEGYTRLYNLVYEAVKRVNPDNQVGGPYAVMASEPAGWDGSPSELAGPWGVVDQRSLDVIDYWLEHKEGADFVVFDAAATVREGHLTTDPFTAVEKFEAVSDWVRERTDLPLWFAEWYVEPRDAGWPEPYRVAVQASAMISLARGDVTTALYWSPQAMGSSCPGCLWTPTTSARGGRPTDMADLLAGFARWFPAGTELTALAVSSPDVEVLAQAEHAVVVNTVDRPTRVAVGDRELSLDPYEVRFVPHDNS
jgi:Glycosyl hydrolases family 39